MGLKISMLLLQIAFPLFLLFLVSFKVYAADVNLDKESTECIKCHETSISLSEDGKVCHSGECGHPMAVDYVSSALKNPELIKPSSLNPDIKLMNNKIGCGTCHIPYDKTNHNTLAKKRREMPSIPDPMLNIDNSQSQLCRTCHRK